MPSAPEDRPDVAPRRCLACGKTMRLFGIEAHDSMPDTSVHTYDCVCGAVAAVNVADK